MALVRVVDIEGRGRALIASRPIRAGEVILSESPLLLYPPPDCTSSSSFCCVCFRTTTLPPALSDGCSACSGVALFCSPRCLAQAMASHSPWTCQALSRLRSLNPHPDLITQAHFLIAAYALPAPDFQRLLSLHGGAHPKPPDQEEELLLLHSLISSPPPPIPGFSPELTAALLAKDKMNSFGLMDPFSHQDRKVRAYGIYPNASFFNHDCLPNACRFDYVDSPGDTNTQIVIRAIHDIPQGREVCLSYFPVNWSYKDRQLRLLEDYGFHCVCDRCEVEKNWKDDDDDEVPESMEQEDEEGEDEEMENDSSGAGPDGDFPHAYFFMSYLCQRENCGGTLAPLPPSPQAAPTGIFECNVCGLLRKDEDADEEDVEDTDNTMRDQ